MWTWTPLASHFPKTGKGWLRMSGEASGNYLAAEPVGSAAVRLKNYLLVSFKDLEASTLMEVSRRLYVGIAPSASSI